MQRVAMTSPPEQQPRAIPAANALLAQLLEQIRQQGPMRFDQYMEQALYTPGLGYYASCEEVFGAEGDFVTAPGLGDFFARVMARFCELVLTETGGGIVEYGVGDGQLARDLQRVLGAQLETYVCVERAAARRQMISDEQARAVMPEDFCGVVLANEFLDALPARSFALTADGVRERMVDITEDDASLCWTEQESAQASAAVAHIQESLAEPLAPPYCSEWRHEVYANWLTELDARLRRGVVLIVDYGYPRWEYYHPQRSTGTLQCHTRHQSHADPFQEPGRQDISVDVDFTKIAELATAAHFDALMFTTQAGFLLEYGLLEMIDESTDIEARMAQHRQIEMLTHPERMGDRFRVLALGRDVALELPHTICPDHRDRL